RCRGNPLVQRITTDFFNKLCDSEPRHYPLAFAHSDRFDKCRHAFFTIRRARKGLGGPCFATVDGPTHPNANRRTTPLMRHAHPRSNWWNSRYHLRHGVHSTVGSVCFLVPPPSGYSHPKHSVLVR